MSRKIIKILAILLCLCLGLQQTGLAQVAAELNIAGYFASLRNSLAQDKFRPLHLRYLAYDSLNNNFELLLDKGDFSSVIATRQSFVAGKQSLDEGKIRQETKILLDYFFIGISLPNDSFWVNLRPDSPDNIIDERLAQTDVGKILLEADLQLKKDTAGFTSPETPEGKEYWDKLYKKAGELFGSEHISIPTLTRPWIVPDEIIIRETSDNAYIYKATLKVMLEEDYLQKIGTVPAFKGTVPIFSDSRSKTINEYSTQLIKELIIPKLTREVNTAKRYAPLRQVYYSLILAQWLKQKFAGKEGLCSGLIDQKNLTGLTSKKPYSVNTYFTQYKKSFAEGEYNLKVPVATPYGRTIRNYMSGGIVLAGSPITEAIEAGARIAGSPLRSMATLNPEAIAGAFYTDGRSPYSGGIRINPDTATSLVVTKNKVIESKRREFSQTIEDVAFCDIAEFVIGSEKEQRFIGTSGLMVCRAIALYNPALKEGAIIHFFPTTDVHQSINIVLSNLKKRGWNTEGQGIQVKAMMGGVIFDHWPEGHEDPLTKKVDEEISTRQWLVLARDDPVRINQNELGEVRREKHFIMDTKTGEVFDLKNPPDRNMKDSRKDEELTIVRQARRYPGKYNENTIDSSKSKIPIVSSSLHPATAVSQPRKAEGPAGQGQTGSSPLEQEPAASSELKEDLVPGLVKIIKGLIDDAKRDEFIKEGLDSSIAREIIKALQWEDHELLSDKTAAYILKEIMTDSAEADRANHIREFIELKGFDKDFQQHMDDLLILIGLRQALEARLEEEDLSLGEYEQGLIDKVLGGIEGLVRRAAASSPLKELLDDIRRQYKKPYSGFKYGDTGFYAEDESVPTNHFGITDRPGVLKRVPLGVCYAAIVPIEAGGESATLVFHLSGVLPYGSGERWQSGYLEKMFAALREIKREVDAGRINVKKISIIESNDLAEQFPLADPGLFRDSVVDRADIQRYLEQLELNNIETPGAGERFNKAVVVSNEGDIKINGVSSSALSEDTKGGVDFRGLPIMMQPMEAIHRQPPTSVRDSPLRGQSLSSLNEEWQEIEKMLAAGITPSSDRIKGYLQSCCANNAVSQEVDKVLSCLAGILRLEEERVSSTEPALKEILALLESDKPAPELQVALSKIAVPEREPVLVEP